MLEQFLQEHQLPERYLEQARIYFDPFIDHVVSQKKNGQALIIGLNGAQGSGKTTLAAYLFHCLTAKGYKTVSVSLDDFYYTLAERQSLSKRIHPLLLTRGVPGTHDLQQLRSLFQAVKAGHYPLHIPRFDKAIDDRVAESEFTVVNEALDILIVEGWCWGARHASPSKLAEPMNPLEREEDSDALWRHYVNDVIRDELEPLYDWVDYWLMLQAPSFACVRDWRNEQEEKLRNKAAANPDMDASAIMTPEQIDRFVAYFERVTHNILHDLPSRSDFVWQLDENRTIINMRQPASINAPTGRS